MKWERLILEESPELSFLFKTKISKMRNFYKLLIIINKIGRSDLIFNTGYKPCGLKQTAN